MAAKKKTRVIMRSNKAHTNPKKKKQKKRSQPISPIDNKAERDRFRQLYEEGLIRPSAILPSIPRTPEDELMLRAITAEWEMNWRKRTPTSRRAAINSLDTVGTLQTGPSPNTTVTLPLVALAGCASGIREFENGKTALLLTCVYGIQNKEWKFVDDHLWLDIDQLYDENATTRIRLFDDTVIYAAPCGYSGKGLDRVGVQLWTVKSSHLPYSLKKSSHYMKCPPIVKNLDLIRVNNAEEGKTITILTQKDSDRFKELLYKSMSGVKKLLQELNNIQIIDETSKGTTSSSTSD